MTPKERGDRQPLEDELQVESARAEYWRKRCERAEAELAEVAAREEHVCDDECRNNGCPEGVR